MTPRSRPKVFVGSSSEAYSVDVKIRSMVESFEGSVLGWRELFRHGDYVLDVLLDLPRTIDCALLIVTADDLTVYREQERKSPRDNVVLEIGILLATLGKYRTGIIRVHEDGKTPPSLPSDLSGLTTINFDLNRPAQSEVELYRWLSNVRSLKSKKGFVDDLTKSVNSNLENIPQTWMNYIEKFVFKNFRSAVRHSARGIIPLAVGDYYLAIYEEMDKATDETKVKAISTLSSAIWKEDGEQEEYLTRNLEAAARGAKIQRLFILPPGEWSALQDVLRIQDQAGIEVRITTPAILAYLDELEDFVLFGNQRTKRVHAYSGQKFLHSPQRLRRARLVLDPDRLVRLEDAFDKAWKKASNYDPERIARADAVPPAGKTPPPGEEMKAQWLEEPVVSCEEAASVKGIPLQNELKSLLLETSAGLVCLELPGDAQASLRAVKSKLGVDQAFVAGPSVLKSMGISPGTVSSVFEPIWSLPHLISRRVLKLDYVSTNNGSLRGFVRFDPRILLAAPSWEVGDFEA